MHRVNFLMPQLFGPLTLRARFTGEKRATEGVRKQRGGQIHVTETPPLTSHNTEEIRKRTGARRKRKLHATPNNMTGRQRLFGKGIVRKLCVANAGAKSHLLIDTNQTPAGCHGSFLSPTRLTESSASWRPVCLSGSRKHTALHHYRMHNGLKSLGQ